MWPWWLDVAWTFIVLIRGGELGGWLPYE